MEGSGRYRERITAARPRLGRAVHAAAAASKTRAVPVARNVHGLRERSVCPTHPAGATPWIEGLDAATQAARLLTVAKPGITQWRMKHKYEPSSPNERLLAFVNHPQFKDCVQQIVPRTTKFHFTPVQIVCIAFYVFAHQLTDDAIPVARSIIRCKSVDEGSGDSDASKTYYGEGVTNTSPLRAVMLSLPTGSRRISQGLFYLVPCWHRAILQDNCKDISSRITHKQMSFQR